MSLAFDFDTQEAMYDQLRPRTNASQGIADRAVMKKGDANIDSLEILKYASETSADSPEESRVSIVPLVVAQAALQSLQPLQEWEGYVTAVGDHEFHARLVDVTARSEIEEEAATFPLDDVAEKDMYLLVEGAVFRWVIGYLRDRSGSKRRVSQIVFRRRPAWTARELSQVKSRAQRIEKELVWED